MQIYYAEVGLSKDKIYNKPNEFTLQKQEKKLLFYVLLCGSGIK